MLCILLELNYPSSLKSKHVEEEEEEKEEEGGGGRRGRGSERGGKVSWKRGRKEFLKPSGLQGEVRFSWLGNY